MLFLPNEMFFAAALDQIPDLYDYAAARDVVLATPTTLIGMLRAVAYGWKQAALAESAAEVFRLGRDLHEKLGLMGNRFDKLGRALRTLGQRLQRDHRDGGGHRPGPGPEVPRPPGQRQGADEPGPDRRPGTPDPGARTGGRRGPGRADGRSGQPAAGDRHARRRPSCVRGRPGPGGPGLRGRFRGDRRRRSPPDPPTGQRPAPSGDQGSRRERRGRPTIKAAPATLMPINPMTSH